MLVLPVRQLFFSESPAPVSGTFAVRVGGYHRDGARDGAPPPTVHSASSHLSSVAKSERRLSIEAGLGLPSQPKSLPKAALPVGVAPSPGVVRRHSMPQAPSTQEAAQLALGAQRRESLADGGVPVAMLSAGRLPTGEPSTMVHGTFTPLSHQSLLADETEARRLLGIFTPEPVAVFGEAGAEANQAAYETYQSAPQAAFIAECVLEHARSDPQMVIWRECEGVEREVAMQEVMLAELAAAPMRCTPTAALKTCASKASAMKGSAAKGSAAKGSAAKGSAAKAKTPTMALAPSPFVFAQLPTPESLGAFPAGGRAGGRAPAEAADMLDVIGSVRAPPSARARYAAEMHAAVVTGVAEAAAAVATDAEAAANTDAPAAALLSLSTEDVAAMKVKELREALETLGLDTSGKRAELATRLVGALEAAKAPAPKAPAPVAAPVPTPAAEVEEAAPVAEAAPASAPSEEEALQASADAVAAMKVAELRELLASRGLDTSGKRVALAERLLAALVAEAVAAPAVEEEPIEWLTSGHEWVGRQILRNLDGIEIDARVTKWAPAEGSDPALWHVVHADHDEEDLDETDMLAAIEAFEQRACHRKGPSLKHKGSKATSSNEASLNRGKRAAAAEPAIAPAEVAPAPAPAEEMVPASVKRSKRAATAPAPAPAPAPEEASLAESLSEAPASAARAKRGAKRGVEPAPETAPEMAPEMAPEPASSARSSRARR